MGSAPVLGPAPRFRYLAPVLVTALAVAFSLRPVDDYDVWYHLAAGRLMWTTWDWPRVNTFSFTAPEHPWIDLHWFFQLLLHASYAVGGFNGCIVLAIGLMAATTGLLYLNARRFVSPAAAAALLAVALTISSPRFVPRPELVSFVLLAAYLWLLDGYPGCGRAIYFLIPLQILWTNVQGIFVVGLALIGCYWIGATLAFLPIPRGWREASGCTVRQWRRLTLVLILAAAGCFANPYGADGVFFPLQLLSRVTGGSLFSTRIGEFRPPFDSGYAPPLAYAWAGLLAVAALTFVLNLRRCHIGRLLAVAAFGLLSTQSLRNMALFAWIAVPGIAANLGTLVGQSGRQREMPRAERRRGVERSRLASLVPPIAEGAVVVAVAFLLATVVTNRFSRFLGIDNEFGFGVSRLNVPMAAVEFATNNGLSGRPFNCLATGGYLAWRLFPEGRVFVDGRLEAYPESFFGAYFRVMDNPRVWPELERRYAPDYVLLYHVWANRYPLAVYLAAGHGWALVYYDEIASLFVPTDDQHREVRERAQQAFAELRASRSREPMPAPPSSLRRALSAPVSEIRRQSAYGNFLRAIGQQAEAVEAYKRALALDPEVSETRFSLAMAYWFAGNRNQSVLELRDIVRRDPSFEPAARALAEAARVGAAGADVRPR